MLAFAFKASCAYWKQVFLTLVETKIVSNLQQTLFRKIIRFDMRHFDRSSIGSVLNHFIADIQNIKQALATIILNVGRDVFTIIFLVSIMFYQNWLMSIFCFIGLPYSLFLFNEFLASFIISLEYSHTLYEISLRWSSFLSLCM